MRTADASTVSEGELRIEPLSPTTWDAFAALVERNGGLFGGCWCTWFHMLQSDRKQLPESNRDLKQRLVAQGKAHAALVMRGDEAIAWAEYGPPEELPNIHHRKQYLDEQDVVPDYRVTCIVTDKRLRHQGLAERALRGAVEIIARQGGGIVEGYPHIVEPGEKTKAQFLYNGTRRMYERVGFEFIRPKGMKNTVMRRTVDADLLRSKT